MLQITELLKKYRLSNVKAIDANGDTILHLVAEDKNFTTQQKIEILKILLEYGLDLRSKNKHQETILHLAIITKARDVIDFLLTRKFDLDSSAARYFIQTEYDRLFKLNNQSSISDDKMQEEETESASFLKWMISRGLDIDRPNRYGRSALSLAIDYSLRHLLPVLLKYTKNIDYVGFETRRTLLHIVLRNKAKTCWPPSYRRRYALSIVKILLDRGVLPESVDSSLDTALHLAITNDEDIDVVQMLIEHTTNFNHKNDAGETPFLIAFRECLDRKKPSTVDVYRKICQSLMMNGADLNEGNNSGVRPLHIFAEKTSSCECLDQEKMELLEMLISVGCNMNADNSDGQTPLRIAAAGCNVSVVQKLIENGARINSRDKGGKTPLHVIADGNKNSTVIAKMLIEHGANVNAKDCEGFTPLHKAAGEQELYSDNSARLKLLLEQGADFCALSVEGYSVLHMSAHKCFNSILIKYGFGDEETSLLEDFSSSGFFDEAHDLNGEVQFLLDHWIKLYAANIDYPMGHRFKTRRIRSGLRYYPESGRIYEDCMKEIEPLKGTFIDNNRTSIYAFLQMNFNSRRAHLHSEKLQQLVQSPAQLETQFPRYGILILSSYNEMLKRKSVMQSAQIAWIELTKARLGDLCIEHIFAFLSNAEMYDLIEAFKIDNYGLSSPFYDYEK